MRSGGVDPALRAELERRGEFAKIRELESAALKSSIAFNAPKAIQESAETISEKTGSFLRETGKAIVQAPQRALTSVALEPAVGILSLVTGKKVEPVFQPKGKLQEAVLGKEPIKGVFQRVSEAIPVSKRIARGAGLPEDVSTGAALALAPLVIAGFTAADVTPVGGAGKQAAKKVGKEIAEEAGEALLKKIPKELQPLAQEARKYKSAEEFVRAQGETVFRAGEKGNFFSESKEYVIEGGFKGNIREAVLPKSQNIFDASKGTMELNKFATPEELKILNGHPTDANLRVIWNDILERNGYAGMKFLDELENGKTFKTTFLTDSAKDSLKTKSQLTDIWNQAIKGAEALPELPKSKTGAVERGFVTSVKEELPNLPKVSGQYIPRSTDDLAIKAKNLIKSDIRTAENLVSKSTDENAVATASELLKHYSQEAEKATSPAIREAIYDKAAEVANTMAAKLTEQGRSVQAASILSRLTPEGQLKFAAREIQKYNETAKIQDQIPELTKDQAKRIVDEMKAIGKMEDGVEKAMRFQELQNYITDLTPSSLIHKLSTIWKAGLLTGLKTTGLNIFSNLSHFGTEIVKDLPATAVDSVVSLFTKERTKAFTIKGVKDGLKEGFDKGARYLKTGFDERNIAQKLDWKRVNFGKSKAGRILQKYEEAVFRSLGSQDQPFYYGAKSRSLYDQATAQAINKKLKGAERTAFIDNLVKNPTDKMLTYAVSDAETAVFQNRTGLGNAAKKLQEIGDGAGEFIVPFGRTPSAVAMQIINYSPAKPIAEIIKLIYNQGKGFDQRAFSQAMGRGITGAGVMFLGAKFYKNNLMNLDYPTGERERELWQAEGRKPNTIKIGDTWRSVMVLGPLGPVLLIGGHFKKQFAESGSPTEAFANAIAGSMKSFTEQTFLTGLNSFLDAIKDPARSAASFAGGFVGSVIPTFVADIARATDSVERRSESILDRVKMRIPGLRESLEPRITVFGDELPRIGNPLEVMIDPTRPSEETVTPVTAEIRRIADVGYNVSPTLLGDKKGYESLTPEQNTELWKRAGTIIYSKLNNLFASDSYAGLDDELKSKKVDSFVEKSKIVARAEKVLELTQGLQGEELKIKLSELKESELMTRDVYNKYLEIR